MNVCKNGLHAKAIGFAKSSLWFKKYNWHKDIKNQSTDTIWLIYKERPSKKYQNSKNEGIFNIGKNGLHANAIGFANHHFGSKKNCHKHIKNESTDPI